MKTYLLFAVFLITASTTSAQEAKEKPWTFSIGAEFATPVTYLKERNGFGLGVSAMVEHKFTRVFSGTFSAGYINYFGQTNDFKYKDVKQIPVLAGIRYYIAKDFFVSGQLGFSYFDGGDVGFTYSPGIGVKFGKSRQFDATLKYMNTQYNQGVHFTNFSLRLGFRF